MRKRDSTFSSRLRESSDAALRSGLAGRRVPLAKSPPQGPHDARANLEKLVAERTRDLAVEVAAHRRTEDLLRQSEEKYRTLIDNMEDGVFLVRNRTIAFANRGIAHMLGYTVEEMLGRPFLDFVALASRKQAMNLHARWVAGEVAEGRYEVELLHREGRTLPVLLNLIRITAPQGEAAVLGTAKDISERKRAELALIAARDELEMRVHERTRALQQEIIERQYAERALQESNAELERRVEERTHHLQDEIAERKKLEAQFLQAQKMEAVGQLAGGIAHDFNNLLMVIQGNLSWLNDVVKADAKTTRLMTMALEAARRAGQLTHRMLAFSRRQDLRPEAVDLRLTLEGMEPLVARALSEAVKLQIRIAPGSWPLMIDAQQLESAILNIALNAGDAMSNGGTFTVSVENRVVDAVQAAQHENAKAGDYVLLSLADSGTGMPPEVLTRAFDPFFTTKEVGKGSGLGLSMVFGFVNQSGGFVEMASTPGAGTVVDIYLPRSPEPVVATADSDGDTTPHFSPDTTVLVVEDDTLVRGVTVEYLRMANVKTLQACDGEAAIAVLEETAGVDVVLSDIIMPGSLSGLDLVAIVRRRWPRTAILFMSGYSYEAFSSRDVGPDTVAALRKPFTKRELLHKIHDVLSAHATER